MTEKQRPPQPTNPAPFGCLALVAAVVFLGFFVGFLILFLGSGAETGKIELRAANTYAPGSYDYNGERNFYLIRLGNGSFLSLADLDAANRAATGHRCRVAPIAGNDPGLASLLDQYRARLDGPVEGSTLLFREDCNGAVYNALGERLDADERNLDRFDVSIDDQGRVVVDVSKRRCSRGPIDAEDSEVQC